MPKKPKADPEPQTGKSDQDKNTSWEKDQKKREYYYDDAHGYQTYDPDAEDANVIED